MPRLWSDYETGKTESLTWSAHKQLEYNVKRNECYEAMENATTSAEQKQTLATIQSMKETSLARVS